jgi:hypothetical protein
MRIAPVAIVAVVMLATSIALLPATAPSAAAADLGTALPLPDAATEATDSASVRAYVARFATLTALRANFDVYTRAEAEWQVKSEHTRIVSAGLGEADRVALDRALLAEGSYYLVSLRYLIEAGGAVWPTDRPEQFYEDDALITLDALQDRLFEAVETRADPLAVFLEAQKIWAWTEGYVDVPAERDVFGHRDEVVGAAMAARANPRVDT